MEEAVLEGKEEGIEVPYILYTYICKFIDWHKCVVAVANNLKWISFQ
jgi:hypothetical protein